MHISFYTLLASAALAAASVEANAVECISQCQAAHWNKAMADVQLEGCMEGSANIREIGSCLLESSQESAVQDCIATCPAAISSPELRRRHDDDENEDHSKKPTSSCLSVCETRIPETDNACTDKSYIKLLFTCVLANCPTEGELAGGLSAFYAECDDVSYPAPSVFLNEAGVNAKTVDVPKSLSGVTATATAFPASVTERAKTSSGSVTGAAASVSATGVVKASATGSNSGAATLKVGGVAVAAVLGAALMML